MARIKNWKPGLIYYGKIIGIECEDEDGIGKLIKNMTDKNLITCPFETIGYTLIVPQGAKRYLFLKNIKHKIVELKSVWHLNEDVLRKLAERYYYDVPPNYYTCSHIITRSFVELAVVKEIQEVLDKIKKEKMNSKLF